MEDDDSEDMNANDIVTAIARYDAEYAKDSEEEYDEDDPFKPYCPDETLGCIVSPGAAIDVLNRGG